VWAVAAIEEVVKHGPYGWTIGYSRQAAREINEFLSSNVDEQGHTCNEYVAVGFSFGCTAVYRTTEAVAKGRHKKKACGAVYVDAVRKARIFGIPILWPRPFRLAPFARYKYNYYQKVDLPWSHDWKHGDSVPGMSNNDMTAYYPGPEEGAWDSPHQWIAHFVEDYVKSDVLYAVEACKLEH
jgi:hypothetical protein